ncbi:uncharacterized protein Z518_05529 [Rhinocladiella mackenziei CBS 650.93]|uniref:Uncharacterized protein n=1 Tax=Rhinocladiella mackenziei CBS 650.93 TaxID=1442369 RepID=A0A0D2IFR7_9EURO|nr:uncharacterized protein Z518_05529 [Rhinocladiella mackenziei CBS 650.93]KIX04659.1 hypothetical protein Z518_05529 [Rhinocladiella mackenziei CBS 650.93]
MIQRTSRQQSAKAEYLVNKATRYRVNATHSAISHRDSPPELWGDFVFMVPPFLAYYGVIDQNMKFLEEVVRQCQLYSEILGTNISLEDGQLCQGLWRHIVSDPAELTPGTCCSDPDVWLTSNAWAIAGITRVLAIILNWQRPDGSPLRQSEHTSFVDRSRSILIKIVMSMLNCTMKQPPDQKSGLLENYLDGPSHPSAEYAYGDTAGTALMISAVYRLAVLLPVNQTSEGQSMQERRILAGKALVKSTGPK